MVDEDNNQLLSLLKIWIISLTKSHPLIFHPSFLATSHTQGQQSFLALRMYLRQLRSAVWSAPFSLAASSHFWKAEYYT